MWINIDGIVSELLGGLLGFVIHAVYLFGICAVLEAVWWVAKRIYRKVTDKKPPKTE